MRFRGRRLAASPFNIGTDVNSGTPVANIFTGIIAEVAVRDSDAWLDRVIYNITLLGRIVFTQVVIS